MVALGVSAFAIVCEKPRKRREQSHMESLIVADRAKAAAFWSGVLAVTIGVVLHLPMFWMGRHDRFHLSGMPMDASMLGGMGLILIGVTMTAWALLPRNVAAQVEASRHISVAAPEDAPLAPAHWGLMAVLVVALVIDVMKPASLGFVMPGLKREYIVGDSIAALFPFSALLGTVVGSVLWGVAADIYGRKATIMLSAVMFVGTAICGAMPSLWWNIAMCFLMGAAAGGMLPVSYALLAEIMPTRHRGWALVLVGGLGSGGGYLAASSFAALLEPVWSWRVLWLLNLPTGLLLLLLGRFIPESAKYLLARGRRKEASEVMRRFGTTSHRHGAEEEDVDFAPLHIDHSHPQLGVWSKGIRGTSVALTSLALGWGLVNFGLLLWLPTWFVERGLPMGAASQLIAKSALIAFPATFLASLIYSRWSTKGSLILVTAITVGGLVGVMAMPDGARGIAVIAPLALLIVGTNALLAIVLPYAAESYPLTIRGRATGWIAACTKAGGLAAQALSIAALVPSPAAVSLAVAVPLVVGIALTWRYCRETRGVDLREVDRGAGWRAQDSKVML